MRDRPIYLDYNATTPCDPRVVETMIPYFYLKPGNASSKDHWYGWQAEDAVNEARKKVAGLINANAKQITFTSGATESINLALKGMAEAMADKGNHIITCRTEHRAVLDTCEALEKKGIQVTYLDVDSKGQISLGQLESAITDKTICIAIMYANNETGIIHPVTAIGSIARKHGVPFFCDATQAVGKIEVDVEADKIDLMAFSSHKLYGPKGIGALYIRNNKPGNILPQQHGGGHERGLRSGTLNTPAIVGFGRAAEICQQEMVTESIRLASLRDRFEKMLQDTLSGISINGVGTQLPHVSNILVPTDNTEKLLLSLSSQIAISRGSACSGLVQRPSHVLKAMGQADEEANRALRISLGRFTEETDIDEAVQYLSQAILAEKTLTH